MLHLDLIDQICYQSMKLLVKLLLLHAGVLANDTILFCLELQDVFELLLQLTVILGINRWRHFWLILLLSFATTLSTWLLKWLLLPVIIHRLTVLHVINHLLLEEDWVHLVHLALLQALVHLLAELLLLLLVCVSGHHMVIVLDIGHVFRGGSCWCFSSCCSWLSSSCFILILCILYILFLLLLELLLLL